LTAVKLFAYADGDKSNGRHIMAIYTTTTIHNVRTVHAHASYSLGAPLTIVFTDQFGMDAAVTAFLGDEGLVKRLVQAINAAATVVPAGPVAPTVEETKLRYFGEVPL
jgi:hypothetical protein